MLKFACFCVALALAVPAWSQVEPAASGGGFELDDLHMMTPPPVSNDVYPVVVGSESHSNYFALGFVATGSYVDNLMLGRSDSVTTSDGVYYLLPSVSLDRRTPRQSETLHYSPGFMLYQNTTELNGVSQDASADYRSHISPYAVIELSERFGQNFNLYNQSNPFTHGGTISGTPGTGNSILIAPFANQISNSSTAGINYQYGRNAMIGGSASYSFLHYSDSSQTAGLNNGNTTGGLGFYTRRIGPSEYVGAAYQFSKLISHPIDTYTISHTTFGFYTHYFTRTFSMSILGGPEHYESWQSSGQKQNAWTPAMQGSIGWQALRTNVNASFSHIVAGVQGLNGAFRANLARAGGQFAFSHTWDAGANVEYSVLDSVVPAAFSGGNTVLVGFDVQHRMKALSAAAGYSHAHVSYSQIPQASLSPDSNRVFVSISYSFQRPLGQ